MNCHFIDNRLCAIEEGLRDLQALLAGMQASLPISDSKEILTIGECSKFTGLSKSTLYKKTCKRLMPCFRNGKMLLFKRQEVLDWMLSNPRKTVAEIEAEANQFVTQSQKV